jgi:hypothetical protein
MQQQLGWISGDSHSHRAQHANATPTEDGVGGVIGRTKIEQAKYRWRASFQLWVLWKRSRSTPKAGNFSPSILVPPNVTREQWPYLQGRFFDKSDSFLHPRGWDFRWTETPLTELQRAKESTNSHSWAWLSLRPRHRHKRYLVTSLKRLSRQPLNYNRHTWQRRDWPLKLSAAEPYEVKRTHSTRLSGRGGLGIKQSDL